MNNWRRGWDSNPR